MTTFSLLFSESQQYWVAGDTRLKPWSRRNQHQFCHWQGFCCIYMPQMLAPSAVAPLHQKPLPHLRFTPAKSCWPSPFQPSHIISEGKNERPFTGPEYHLPHSVVPNLPWVIANRFFHRVNDFGKLWKALPQREQCRTKFLPVGVKSLTRLAWAQLSQEKGIHPTPEKEKSDPGLWKVTKI